MLAHALDVLLALSATSTLAIGCAAAPTKPAPEATASGSSATPVTAGAEPTSSEPKAVMCGGIAGLGCPADQFCDYGSHCGAGDQSGVCKPIPGACTTQYLPVCGCDGKTYSNACVAHAAKVSVAADGPCAKTEPTPPMPPR